MSPDRHFSVRPVLSPLVGGSAAAGSMVGLGALAFCGDPLQNAAVPLQNGRRAPEGVWIPPSSSGLCSGPLRPFFVCAPPLPAGTSEHLGQAAPPRAPGPFSAVGIRSVGGGMAVPVALAGPSPPYGSKP